MKMIENHFFTVKTDGCNGINFIEMEDGYANKIKKEINNIVQE